MLLPLHLECWGLQVCTTMLGGSGDHTQGFMHGRETLDLLSHIPAHSVLYAPCSSAHDAHLSSPGSASGPPLPALSHTCRHQAPVRPPESPRDNRWVVEVAEPIFPYSPLEVQTSLLGL